jgi:hypothetical protein
MMQNNNIKEPLFVTNIELLDSHINYVLKNGEASYGQVSFLALTVFGFILSHGGMKNTSLMMLDFSNSGTGKSLNISLQYDLLLKSIVKRQDDLQLGATDEEGVHRYINVHRGRITLPALYQCLQTIPAQLVMMDELGLYIKKNNEIVTEITKLYGTAETQIPVLKTEAPSSKSIIPVALSFVGATTLSYFGGVNKLKHHLSGGFANRALVVYNNRLKLPEEITSLTSSNINSTQSNKMAIELLAFILDNNTTTHYSNAAENVLVAFKKEVQMIKNNFHRNGHENYLLFYNRVVQNTQIIVNIFHALKCFEHNHWDDEIHIATAELGIAFMKQIVFPEIEKLIDYLSDIDLLKREEKYKAKTVDFVQKYYLKHGTMPKIRDVSNLTRLSRSEVLELTKDFLEIVPASTVFRYINESH